MRDVLSTAKIKLGGAQWGKILHKVAFQFIVCMHLDFNIFTKYSVTISVFHEIPFRNFRLFFTVNFKTDMF